MTKAYVKPSSELCFGVKVPANCYELAETAANTGTVAEKSWRRSIKVLCRLGYRDGTWLVPGFREAKTEVARGTAIFKFQQLLAKTSIKP